MNNFKTALITGASSGIGYELAKLFAKEKINLVLVSRNVKELEKLANEIIADQAIQVTVIPADLCNLKEAENVHHEIKVRGIEIEYLVNNAGFGEYGFFTDTDWLKELRMINVNIVALTYFTKVYLQEMMERKSGKIMNVASTAAFEPGPMMSVYHSTKAYVLSLTEAISNEIKGKAVTITALCPGPTVSGFKTYANIQDVKMFKRKRLPSSYEVALFGYKAMMKGRTVAIHGFFNHLLVFSTRLAPRFLVLYVVRKIYKKKK